MKIELADGSVLELPEGQQLVDLTTVHDDRKHYTLSGVTVQVRGDALVAAIRAEIREAIRELGRRGAL